MFFHTHTCRLILAFIFCFPFINGHPHWRFADIYIYARTRARAYTSAFFTRFTFQCFSSHPLRTATLCVVLSGILYAVAAVTVIIMLCFLLAVLSDACCSHSKFCCLVGVVPAIFFVFSIVFGESIFPSTS